MLDGAAAVEIARVLEPANRAIDIDMGVFYTLYHAAMMLGAVVGGAASKWAGSAAAAFDIGALALLACPLLFAAVQPHDGGADVAVTPRTCVADTANVPLTLPDVGFGDAECPVVRWRR